MTHSQDSSLWAPRRRIEEEYKAAIKAALKKLGAYLVGLDDNDPFTIVNVLRKSMNDPWFNRYCEATAMKMVTHLFSDSGRTWRQAARANSQSRMIYETLQEEMNGALGGAMHYYIQKNAEYIRSVPGDIARQMTNHILEQSMAGVRASDIAQSLKGMFPHLSDVKANLIARTETSKTSTALTQARSEILGIDWYRWRTSEDSRVRESHKHMDKVLVSWDDPPSPEELDHEKDVGRYHAGCIWNCRCYTEPVVDVNFITWPSRVYIGGRIVMMTKAQFEQLTRKRQAV